jgi:Flp pilus assembly protein TadD
MGRMEEAAGFLRRATEGMPEHSRAFYNLGLVYQQLGEFSGAEAALVSALALEPENPDYLLALADFYIKQNRLEEALAIADRMIAVDAARDTGREVRAHIESLMRSRGD